ncbi:MAG: hypothetical protein EAZ70_05020 [Runella slithyformis]|nr:MAG: hypothetical protein EAY79_04415 [Runella slithyformis]TAF28599.1 MAG: hypothetical protein EAZ70_05020 [Runella slithyformis]TAF47626.1 MAG: hypothetical protein EAZ63_07410 [Runella slithyformis]
MKISQFLYILLALPVGLRAQVPRSAPPPRAANVQLTLLTRYTGKDIRLRWAPNRAGAWSLLNRAGYVVERFELDANGNKTNLRKLSVQPIKPEPLEQWARFAKGPQNENALIAAQAIYGKSFATKTTTLDAKADELTNRYSFTLLAADLSFEAAQAAGLGIIDPSVQLGRKYFYRLYAAQKLVNYAPVDTTLAIVDTRNIEQLPRPVWQQPNEGELHVDLLWNKSTHQNAFTAYYLERSPDGRTYQRLNQKPYINMDSEAEDKPDFIYTDSLKANYQPFYYRLVGISAFGEESTPSEPVKAMARDRTPPRAPFDVKAKSLGGKRVEITWNTTPEADLAGFYVGRSQNSLENFKPLTTKPLFANSRRFIDENAEIDTTNYYLIIAVDTAQNAAASLSAYSIIIDSLPPSKPTGLTARIDKKGIVKLRWNKNPERDVKGYVVLYANQRGHFFTTAVKRAIRDTLFTDTLQLWTLTEKIYYQVKAVDKNDNTSGASNILEVGKPDIVPPSSPLFSGYEIQPKGVLLKWVGSTSKDVVQHRIYRKAPNEKSFQELTTALPNAPKTYFDASVRANTSYQYLIEAEDDANLLSVPSPVLTINVPDYTARAGTLNLRAQYNTAKKQVEINWQNPTVPNAYIVVYRAENGGAFTTLGTATKGVSQYQDQSVKPRVSYEYTTRVFYADGQSSPFGAVVQLTF